MCKYCKKAKIIILIKMDISQGIGRIQINKDKNKFRFIKKEFFWIKLSNLIKYKHVILALWYFAWFAFHITIPVILVGFFMLSFVMHTLYNQILNTHSSKNLNYKYLQLFLLKLWLNSQNKNSRTTSKQRKIFTRGTSWSMSISSRR